MRPRCKQWAGLRFVSVGVIKIEVNQAFSEFVSNNIFFLFEQLKQHINLLIKPTYFYFCNKQYIVYRNRLASACLIVNLYTQHCQTSLPAY